MATGDTTSSLFDRRSVPQPPSFTSPAAQPGAEGGGQAARPARRRQPRASKRAPVTVLNTDATNFRAMVQQFTGFPTRPPYYSGYRHGGVVDLNFNDPTSAAMAPLGRIQQHQYQEQYYQPQQQQQQQYQYPETTISNSSQYSNGFLQGLNNSATDLEMADGFLFDGMSSQRMMRTTTSVNKAADEYFS